MPVIAARLTVQEPLLRGSLKALYLGGVFRDLPLEAQLHPASSSPATFEERCISEVLAA